jgi:hypothetical protein
MASAQRQQDKTASIPSAPENRAEKPAPQVPGAKNWFAQITGILVFILGVAIILYVLHLGFDMYSDPSASLLAFQKAGVKDPNIAMAFAGLVLRLALLFFGSISGSLIANKGINLYFTSLRRD